MNNYITAYERRNGIVLPQNNTTIEIQKVNVPTYIKVTKKCFCEYCGYTTKESFYIKDENKVNIYSNNICPQCCATLKIATKEEFINEQDIKEKEMKKEKQIKSYKKLFLIGAILIFCAIVSFIAFIPNNSFSSCVLCLIVYGVPGAVLIFIANQKRKALKKEKLQED